MPKSNIEWTEETWNPTTSCSKLSAGCRNCYAEIMHKRLNAMGLKKYRRKFNHGAFLDEESLAIPLKRKKPIVWFVNSMSDLWHENLSLEDIAKVYAIMFLTPQHTYQVLTKRADRRVKVFRNQLGEFTKLIWQYANKYHDKYIKKLEGEMHFYDEVYGDFPYHNIWEGTSIENKETLDRLNHLRYTPAAIRFVSAEPLLEDLGEVDLTGIHWYITGGESGHKKRPCNVEWFRSLRAQCKQQGVPFFMKQIDKVQKIPKDLQIRQYPKIKKQKTA